MTDLDRVRAIRTEAVHGDGLREAVEALPGAIVMLHPDADCVVMVQRDDVLAVIAKAVHGDGLDAADLLDETSEAWVSVERAIWPEGPAHGHGSGAYAGLKARVIAALRETGWSLAGVYDIVLPESLDVVEAAREVVDPQPGRVSVDAVDAHNRLRAALDAYDAKMKDT